MIDFECKVGISYWPGKIIEFGLEGDLFSWTGLGVDLGTWANQFGSGISFELRFFIARLEVGITFDD